MNASMPNESAVRDQVRRVMAAADGFDFGRLEPHDYQEQATAVLDMLRPLVSELGLYRALELGTPEGLVSAKCEDASHPVWLREPDDMRGCPWCRIAKLEAQADKVSAFCAQRAEYVTNLRAFVEGGEHDYYRWTGHAEARRQLSQSLGLPVGWPAEDRSQTEDSHERKVAEVHPSHPSPCRVPNSPDCACPVTPEQARRIERDRPETATSHDCTIPLTRRLDCGHCPHEICQDCQRCPHTCRCAVKQVAS